MVALDLLLDMKSHMDLMIRVDNMIQQVLWSIGGSQKQMKILEKKLNALSGSTEITR